MMRRNPLIIGTGVVLMALIKNLSVAVGEVQRFIAETRDKTSEQIQRLADVTQNLADHRMDLEQLLHVAPNGIANGGLLDYNADTGSVVGSFVLNNFANPVQFVCSGIGAIENTTAPETAKLCAQYLGPALRLLNFNELPFPINLYLMPAQQKAIYTDPNLAPNGAGAPPGPPEQQPVVSAYTGLNGDVPPPPGWAGAGLPPMPPGLYTPLPAYPSPALYPPSPNSTPVKPPNVEHMLLSAEAPPPADGGTPPS